MQGTHEDDKYVNNSTQSNYKDLEMTKNYRQTMGFKNNHGRVTVWNYSLDKFPSFS